MLSSTLISTITILSFIPSTILGLVINKRQAPSCVIGCIAVATKGTDCATLDINCLCTNQNFVDTISTCLYNECSSVDEQKFGASYAQSYCQAVFVTVVIVPSATPNAYITPGEGNSQPGSAQDPSSNPSPQTLPPGSGPATTYTGSASNNSITSVGVSSDSATSDGISSNSLNLLSGLLPGEGMGSLIIGLVSSWVVFGLGL